MKKYSINEEGVGLFKALEDLKFKGTDYKYLQY